MAGGAAVGWRRTVVGELGGGDAEVLGHVGTTRVARRRGHVVGGTTALREHRLHPPKLWRHPPRRAGAGTWSASALPCAGSKW
jgi:hypothetical protein